MMMEGGNTSPSPSPASSQGLGPVTKSRAALRLLQPKSLRNRNKSDSSIPTVVVPSPAAAPPPNDEGAARDHQMREQESGYHASAPGLGLAELLLLLHDRALPMGPDRTEFAQNLALTIMQLIDRQIGPAPSSMAPPTPPSSPSLSPPQPFPTTTTATTQATQYSFPRGRAPRVASTTADRPKVAATFEDIISEPMLAHAFHSHLSKSHCSENLEFYDAVDEFRFLWPHDAASLVDDRCRAMADSARHIWDHFVAPGAPMQVNIDGDLTEAIQSQLETPCTTIFDEAQSAVRLLMVDGLVGRFVLSPEYKVAQELLQAHENISIEHGRIRKWLSKMADSERTMNKLEEQKRELEHKFASTMQLRVNPRGARSLLQATNAAPAGSLIGRGAQLQPPTVPVSSSIALGPSTFTSCNDGSSTDTPSLSVLAPPSSSSSETTLRHIKHSWNSVLPHKKEKRKSKSYDQLVSKKRFWQREPSSSAWVLMIGVIQAKELVPREVEGTNNPYVVVKFGQTKFQTSVSLSDTHPRWREYFNIHVAKDDEAHRISVKLCHHSGASSQTVGEIKLHSPRAFSSRSDRWYPLEPKREGIAVTGEIRLQIYYRPQRNRECELHKTLKQLNRSIEEEEREITKEEQRQRKRHGNHMGGWTSSQDDAAPSAAPLAPPPPTGASSKWRHSALVIVPPASGRGVTAGYSKLLRQLNERKGRVQRELLQLQIDLERSHQKAEKSHDRSPVTVVVSSSDDAPPNGNGAILPFTRRQAGLDGSAKGLGLGLSV